MVSVPNLLARPLPPEPVENKQTPPSENKRISHIENGSVPTTDHKSRSYSVPEVIPTSRSPRIKKYRYEDFEYLKVLGKGSFGKVMGMCASVCI